MRPVPETCLRSDVVQEQRFALCHKGLACSDVADKLDIC